MFADERMRAPAAPLLDVHRALAALALAAGLVILVVLAGVALFLVLRAKDLVGTPAGDFTGGDGFIGYIRPLVAGTLISALIALLIATPVGIGVALFVSHYAPRRLAAPVGYVIDLLAAIPSVIFGLWGGAIADALDRRLVVIGTTLGLAGTALMLALLPDNVWLILGAFALQQAFFGVNQPTRSAIYARLVPPAQLPAANSLNMTVMQFGAIAGPMLGAPLIPVIGVHWLYALDAASLMVTLWAVWKLPSIKAEDKGQSLGLRSVIDGFRYLAGHKVLLMSFVVDIIAMVFGMPRALFPQIAHENFGDPVEGGWVFGALFAAMSVGAVLGGVLSGWTSRVARQGLAVIVLWGLAIGGFGVAAHFG